VAAQKNTRRKNNKKHIGLIFWPAFFILVIGLFMVNRELIRNTLEESQIPQRLFRGTDPEQNPPAGLLPDLSKELPSPEIPDNAPEPPPLAPDETPAPAGSRERQEPERLPDAEVSGGDRPQPEPEGPPDPSPRDLGPQAPSSPAPAAVLPAEPSRQTQPVTPAPQPAPRQTRERTVYFIRVDPDGTILRTKAVRQLTVSDSPMLDALRSLLQGPTPEEQRRDLKNFIPQGTRILSAMVRGETAYISFSEEFQYNTYGVEGYAAQLQQIVWTATEFPNVKDVQFLIEGRRIDYLGESIWIGSPIDRE
jgi:hypothetical protein